VVRAAGYRTGASAHHWATFQALSIILGSEAAKRADYFDTCRQSRHTIIYGQTDEVAEVELAELLSQARAFRTQVLDWLRANHPELLPQP
jgi:hypothetical protein